MVSRYKQRVLVLEALYMYEIHNATLSLDTMLNFAWTQYSREQLEYSTELLTNIIENIENIDSLFTSKLNGDKSIYNIEIIDKVLLRIAVAEICILEIDPKIVINESVALAQQYSTDYSYKLINGILNSVMLQFIREKTEHSYN